MPDLSRNSRKPSGAQDPLRRLLPEFPPELRLILDCLRIPPAGLDSPTIRTLCGEVADWEALIALVDRHRVAPLVFNGLKQSAWDLVPESARGALLSRHRSNALRALALAAETARLCQLLEDAKVAVLAYKGAALAIQIHGKTSLRHAGDIDLLVSPRDVESADRILRQSAYRRESRVFDLTAAHRAAYMRVLHHVGYVSEANGLPLELHWRLHSPWRLLPLDFGLLHGRRQAVEIAGRQVPAPSLEDTALSLFVHGAKHRWYRLFWLCDVAQLFRADHGWPWDAFVDNAARLGVARPVIQGAVLANLLLDCPLPPAIRRRAEADPATGRLVGKAIERIREEPLARSQAIGAAIRRDLPYLSRLRSDWPYKISLLHECFLTPHDWLFFPLPDKLFFLYYPLRPFLWILRRLRGWNERIGQP